MARSATGTVFERPKGEFRARFRWDGKSKTVHLKRCSNLGDAETLRTFAAEQLGRLRDAKREEFAEKLFALVAESSIQGLPRVEKGVNAIVNGNYRTPGDSLDQTGPTFREFAECWTSGELHRQFPDHVKVKKTFIHDAYRLSKHVFPIVGEVALKAFTLEHAQEVLRRLPGSLSVASRRQIAQLMSHVLKLAAYPARHIEQSPLPNGFLPKVGSNKATQWLYPEEDRRLLRHLKIPVAHRLFYGFLAREGTRKSEALGLRWDDLDLERGTVRLDENKTDDPRTWALDPGVSLALVLWRKRLTEGDGRAPHGSSLVFAADWNTMDDTRAATRFREHLTVAGVKRAELFEQARNRSPIRLHDLRATFVTLSLANDKTEAWVCDRTGHRSSQMVNRYRRSARTAAELNLGTLEPLYRAIPELSAMVPEPSPPDSDSPKHNLPDLTPAQMQQETTRRNGDDAFRFQYRKVWGFKSLLAHEK